MRIVTYENERDTNPGELELTWEALTEDLLGDSRETACSPCIGHKCEHKKGWSWSPVRILPVDAENHQGTKSSGTRGTKSTGAITVGVFDLDDVTDAELAEFEARIAGIRGYLHSTHSHISSVHNSLRFVFELSREVLPEEWFNVWSNTIQKYKIPADKSCKDPGRLYFLPSHPKGAEFVSKHFEGVPLDVDSLLSSVKLERSAYVASQVASQVAGDLAEPVASAEQFELPLNTSAVGRAIEQSLREHHSDSLVTFRRILQGQVFVVPGQEKHPELPSGRDSTIGSTVYAIARHAPLGATTADVVEIMRPSIQKMNCITIPSARRYRDVDNGQDDFQYWLDVVEYLYNKARPARELDLADDAPALGWVRRREMLRKEREAAVTIPPAPGIPGGLSYSELEAGVEVDSYIYTKEGLLKAVGHNIKLALKEPELKGVFRWNEISKKVVVSGGPYAKYSQDVLNREELITNILVDYLEKEKKFTAHESLVGPKILIAALENAYNPLQDYLNSLEWDGVSRIDNFLLKYCHAKTKDSSDQDITAHVQRVSACFFIAAVARALNPGCQVDNVLVLEGAQGKKKTTVFRILGEPWGCETAIALGDKDSRMLASFCWIVELAELVSLRKAENATHKAFLTTTVDTYRQPYGKGMISTPRTCIFVGTTNDSDYLTDRTGNRRYWPIGLENVVADAEGVARDRDQLWAEAVSRFRVTNKPELAREGGGERWWLVGAEEVEAESQAEDRLAESPIETSVLEWWYGKDSIKRPKEVTVMGVAEEVLGKERLSDLVKVKTLTPEIAHALVRLGFTYAKRKTVNGVKHSVYVPSVELLAAPKIQQRDSTPKASTGGFQNKMVN